jgi:hypothetical protein
VRITSFGDRRLPTIRQFAGDSAGMDNLLPAFYLGFFPK